MELTITGHQLEVTPALREYTAEKLSPLQRHFERITGIHVVLNVVKLQQIAEATINIPGADIHATSEESDMYAAIDNLASKLDRQLKKHKEKLQTHRE